MTHCEICSQNKDLNKVIYETENWIITSGPMDSKIIGYLYMAPKRHLENWFEFNENELLEIGMLIKKVEEALRDEINLERLYTVNISEVMRHIHIHLIPRESGHEDIKGLALIEQATSQVIKTNKNFNSNEAVSVFSNIKKKLKI